MIVKGTFVSSWNEGMFENKVKCKINTDTKEVFDIKNDFKNSSSQTLYQLEEEHIEMDNGHFPVYGISNAKEGNYWYKEEE